MPRTKKAASKQKNTRKTDQDPRIELGLKIINDAEEIRLGQLQADRKNDLDTIKCEITTCMLSVPRGLLDLTLGEISRGEFPVDKTWNSRIVLGNSTLANASNTLHSTQSTIQKTGSRLKKTASHLSTENDDEGYTTAESTRGTTSGSSKRSRSQTASKSNLHQLASQTLVKRSRRSRSVDKINSTEFSSGSTRQSRSRTKEHAGVSRSHSRTTSKISLTTPLNRKPTGGTGTITPKCNKNTPLLFMRRPKVGEMAWSNQGSPLLVYGATAQDRIANINIPIGDDVLSLMPTRGAMRPSEIPQIEGDTKKQLETLRDNLIKVCDSIRK
ncbi:borealin isoform X1 [Dendroctonus ponderosae]|uniref:Borealin C-terminal domain-containing protein n=1 Tax=Dendroctonus ponderosae TaxID=77166 RepID=U4UJH6_DENPD|nr:borealin isoform X1 [Dendroctonus ponderosae]ERL93262.1 hypothetical protein D910_10558 [Dendroctonus ponderosae]KAH1010740.1 hypothetical protein HUJ05_004990 [Dendroctonus ponderosae]